MGKQEKIGSSSLHHIPLGFNLPILSYCQSSKHLTGKSSCFRYTIYSQEYSHTHTSIQNICVATKNSSGLVDRFSVLLTLDRAE